MHETPLVSVVIPTRNRQGMISRCLEPLARQTYSSCEIIVVDDCSDDDTPQFLARFAEDHPAMDFRWLRNDPQAGANPSRNRGIRESKGEYVAFLDDDCIPAENWLERLLAAFTSPAVAAVTGRVDDPTPANIYELAFKGTHRVDGRTHAVRLIAGNMCIRRALLEEYTLDEDRAAVDRDTSVSGRGDEDGLFLMLRAAGYEQRVAENAAVFHEHYYTRRSFFRQAYRGGGATARLGYKYHLPPRVELLPLLLAWVLLPLIWVRSWWWAAPATAAGLFLAAILYNELVRKRKTIGEAAITMPVLVAFYHVRLLGYIAEHLRILTGRTRIPRVRLPHDQRVGP